MKDLSRICGKTRKRMFKTEKGAQLRGMEIGQENENFNGFRVYKCMFCGFYHLTTQEIKT